MVHRSVVIGGILLLMIGAGPARAQENAQLRLIIALADVASVDVYWNGRQKAQNFDYASISVHLTVPAGVGRVAVAPVGQGVDAAFAGTTIDLAAGTMYTLAIVGQRDDLSFRLYEDTLTAPQAGSARLRLIHAAPAHGPIALRIARGATLIETLPYAHSSRYVELAGGRYQFQITPAAGQELLETQRDRRLLAGTIYDLVVLDQGNGVLVALDTYTPIRVLPATGATARLPIMLCFVALVLLLGGGMLRRSHVPRF